LLKYCNHSNNHSARASLLCSKQMRHIAFSLNLTTILDCFSPPETSPASLRATRKLAAAVQTSTRARVRPASRCASAGTRRSTRAARAHRVQCPGYVLSKPLVTKTKPTQAEYFFNPSSLQFFTMRLNDQRFKIDLEIDIIISKPPFSL
jgi:hypothetical protein